MIYAAGSRVLVRDAEWLIKKVDRTSGDGEKLSCIGISELVKNKEIIFLTDIEQNISVLDPAQTDLVQDTSSSYNASLLYIESLLRQTSPTGQEIYIGHKAAMDLVPYQLDPSIMALKQPRQRILISDAVGLGKTLEAGILVSELIRRGRGKRILVLAVKSMLTQFQKEFWNRFSIPLTRLDSIGLQRVKSKIPTNHNPFYYYDRSIISIDTLKQDAQYRTYLEDAYWDIIIIDEAHNVADRGTGSKRNNVAKLLASRSDTLIMLSATPHDGKAVSFASLMNMLNPTAIANQENYTKEDIKGLFIRRFKKDIQNQVKTAFKERKISEVRNNTTLLEENAFDYFVNMKLIESEKKGSLFKTTLEKALFSSPSACIKTIENRIDKLSNAVQKDVEYKKDIELLKGLKNELEKITKEDFSKYQKLLDVIKNKENGFGWNGKDKTDRIVIFTERIETINFLADNLLNDLGLNEKQICKLHGSLPDIEQQKIVEDFGKEESPIRLMIASDVASEGINLHYLSHRLIHFDIPWSLMVFQQRNGRIDRYGQKKTPEIVYLFSNTNNEKIKGDMRILEVLKEKDQQAYVNIEDPSAFLKTKDIEEQESLTAKAIESGKSVEEFNDSLDEDVSLFDLMLEEMEKPKGETSESFTYNIPTLFNDTFSYVETALNYQKEKKYPLQVEFLKEQRRIEITLNDEIKHRFKFLPNEVLPDDRIFRLSDDIEVIKNEIERSRKDETAWPKINYLWEQHPLVEWINDKVLSSFSRHQAPIILIPDKLKQNEVIFIISGVIPNRKSHPLINEWLCVSFFDSEYKGLISFSEIIEKTQLGKIQIPNTGEVIDISKIKKLLPKAIKYSNQSLIKKRLEFNNKMKPQLQDQLNELQKLKNKQFEQLEIKFDEKIINNEKRETEKRYIDKIFDEYNTWIKESMETEDSPYIQVVAVLVGK